MKSAILGFAMLFVFSVICFGQTAPVTSAPAATAAPVAVAPSPTPALISSVSSIVDKIPSSIPAWIIALIAIVSDLALRIWPTVNPKSLFMYAGLLFAVIGSGFTKLSGLLDNVVQNIKDPAAKS